MKTIKEWFATLPDDIRERAYINTPSDHLEYYEECSRSTLYAAIGGAFIWYKTPEGYEFWALVARGKFDEARELLTENTTKS